MAKRSGRSSGNPAGRRRREEPKDKGAGVVWIKTEPTLDGSAYVVTLEASDDVAVTLTPDQALTYAQGVLAAAHRAAYDAAVARQLTERFGLGLSDAADIMKLLRDDRPPLDPADTAPMLLEPGVNQELKPFLALHINGKHVGQWDVERAEIHAITLLGTVGVSDLDSAYYRMLISQLQIDEQQARAAVADLANFRGELM